MQIKDVRDHRKEDRMESFFLAETTKYLYLLFDTDNFIHNRGQHGMVVKTPWGECVLEAGGYIFNTGMFDYIFSVHLPILLQEILFTETSKIYKREKKSSTRKLT